MFSDVGIGSNLCPVYNYTEENKRSSQLQSQHRIETGTQTQNLSKDQIQKKTSELDLLQIQMTKIAQKVQEVLVSSQKISERMNAMEQKQLDLLSLCNSHLSQVICQTTAVTTSLTSQMQGLQVQSGTLAENILEIKEEQKEVREGQLAILKFFNQYESK